MAVIHFPEKVKQDFIEKFNQASETDALFSHDLDMEFSGVKTVHVYSVKTEPLQDYDRSRTVGTGSRYGTTKEVGDEVQTFTMTQDKSLSLSIDKGNNIEQFNMKKAGKVMKAEREEVIVPEVDVYRLNAWAEAAGIHYALDADPTKATIATQIITLKSMMRDRGVPDKLTLLVKRSYIPILKLSEEWIKLDSLGGKTLPRGTIGEFDGMPVKEITSSRMPANVAFMIIYKGSVIAPMKINDYKGHVDPPGLSGDLLEFRLMHDAFVLGTKCNGVAVAVLPGYVAEAPTITISGGTATLACATSDAVIKYTTDGSDPRYSVEVKTGTSVSAPAGTLIRAYACKDGLYHSDVTEETA